MSYDPIQTGPRSTTGPKPPKPVVAEAYEFTFEATAAEPPTGSEIRLDNPDQTKATKLWIKDQTVDLIAVRNGLLSIQTGATVYVQDKDDSTRWQQYTVTAAPVGKTGYVEVPASFSAGGQPLPEQRVRLVVISALPH